MLAWPHSRVVRNGGRTDANLLAKRIVVRLIVGFRALHIRPRDLFHPQLSAPRTELDAVAMPLNLFSSHKHANVIESFFTGLSTSYIVQQEEEDEEEVLPPLGGRISSSDIDPSCK
ncbi:unnamed protein product [Hydatigera taeniaeformis]|uniref:Uncharacterized protein n=1 Tax=Hydatigena taeniaeformis TaxID=6205 RepID=A0A0R3WLZ6_HYDTA|nr:unnamed protein product [Hydatigera taeniaeformis]